MYLRASFLSLVKSSKTFAIRSFPTDIVIQFKNETKPKKKREEKHALKWNLFNS